MRGKPEPTWQPHCIDVAAAVPTDAEIRLAQLVSEAEHHRASMRTFGRAGYLSMVDRHQKLLHLVQDQIRQLCVKNRLVIPSSIPSAAS